MNKNQLNKVFKIYEKEVNFDIFEETTLMFLDRILSKNLSGKEILEVGCGLGKMTKYLSKYDVGLTVIEGSLDSIVYVKNNINSKKVKFIHTLWEDFKTDKKFSDIVFLRGLEHVQFPEKVLLNLKKYLKKDGKIHISVPNADSFHRDLGVAMGMIKANDELTKSDLSVGHYNVYNFSKLESLFNSVEMKIIKHEGVCFKPFSNSQMQTIISDNDKIKEGLFYLGKSFPKKCAEIYVSIQSKESANA
jgi:2-polyprenyl-3-methyl-5-hydroxy-6-metoxy-1,4-benzoquinol methylase